MIRRPVLERALQRLGRFAWLLPVAFLIVFFLLPLSNVLRVMAASGGLVSLQGILSPLWFTIWQAVLSTLLTLLVGLPAALLLARYRFRGRDGLRLLSTLPFLLPTVVAAAGFSALLGPRGLLNNALVQLFGLPVPPIRFMNTLGAILLAHVFYNTSVVIRIVGSALAQMDPRLEEAGKTLGSSPWHAFRSITLPLLRPQIFAAALMVFLFDFTSFGVILLLGGPHFATLETAIYTQTLSMLNLRMAGILSVIQLACTLGITLLHARLTRGSDTPLVPRLRGEGTRSPGSWTERCALILLALFFVALFGAPLLALVLRSVTVNGMFSITYYQELFINRNNTFFYVPPIRAAMNSLGFAGVTMLISSGLGLVAATALVHQRGLKRWLDPLIMLPLGTSAVTLGLGFLITFNRPPLDVKSFPLLIPLAHSLVALPFVVRTLQPALASIPASLTESAAVLGASAWRVWSEIEIPILKRSILVGLIYGFTLSLGEFGATSFLARPETPTLPVAIYRYLSQPGDMNYGQAMAMGTILLVICAVAVALLDRLQGEQRRSI